MTKEILIGNETFITMPVEDFIYKTKTPLIQRDHVTRVHSGKVDYFNNTLINHRVVYLAEYVGERINLLDGEPLNKGDLLVMDGNTRKYFWKQAIETLGGEWDKFAKESVLCGIRKLSSISEINAWYDTFDSKFQLKTAKDNAKSAANLLGLEDYMLKNMSSAVSKVIRIRKPEGMTEVDFVKKKIEMFGVDVIREFYETFEDIVPSKVKNKLSPFIVAYRALTNELYEKRINIDYIFHEMFSGSYAKPINKAGENFISLELNNMFLQDGVYSYLNPRSSGDRIPIVSAVVYQLVKDAVVNNKYYVSTKRKPFAQSNAGSERAMQIFYENIAEKIL